MLYNVVTNQLVAVNRFLHPNKYVYNCSAGRLASSGICLVWGCHGVPLVVRGVSRSFSGVSEPGHAIGAVGFKLV